MARKRGEKCDWCGTEVLEGDGYRLIKPAHKLSATFDRLEHVVPWIMKGPDWHIRAEAAIPEGAAQVDALTGEELAGDSVYLVHHRGEHRIVDGFANTENALEWAKAGGRYS